MFRKSELLDAIDDLEKNPATFQNCQKLATFYLLYDHLYGNSRPDISQESVPVPVLDEYGQSEFLTMISGRNPEKVFPVLDELMQSVKILQPRLYDATLTSLSNI